MATAASVTTDLITCPICLDIFDNPKSLPCLHALCLRCLEPQFKDKRPRDEANCPVCRQEFQIPSGGLGGLQHHFFVQQLVDVRKASSEESTEVPCAVCLEESDGSSEDIATATVYCVDCKQRLCERCSRPHRRWVGGAHQLRPLGAELEQELTRVRENSCDKHKDEQVKLYCKECNKNICVICFAVKHRGHECDEILEAAEIFQSIIATDDERILSNISAVRQQLETTKQVLSKFLQEVDSVEKKVVETGEHLKRIVDNHVSELVSEMQSVKSQTAKQAQGVLDQLQMALVAMESFHAYSRELLDNGRPSDVTRAAHELHDRAMELWSNDVTAMNFRPSDVTFTPADVTCLSRMHLVGDISITKDDDAAESAGSPSRSRKTDEAVEQLVKEASDTAAKVRDAAVRETQRQRQFDRPTQNARIREMLARYR